jgi:magnesium chelatase accessory protein
MTRRCIGILSLMTVNCNRHLLGDSAAAKKLVPTDWPYREASQIISVGGLDWHVQCHEAKQPSGTTIVLIHGTGASTHSWADLIEPLRRSACLVVIDLPGHGFTRGAVPSRLTLPLMANDVQELLLQLKLEGDVVLVGHSAGAPLAIEWALRFSRQGPQRFRTTHILGLNPSLVPPPSLYTTLLGPVVAPIATSSPMTGMLAFIAANTKMVDQLLDSTASKISEQSRVHYRYLFSQTAHVQGAMGFMAGADLPSILSRSKTLDVPTYFLLGAQDTWVKEALLKDVLRDAFPKSKVDTWPGGHLLHEERPQAVANWIYTILFTA